MAKIINYIFLSVIFLSVVLLTGCDYVTHRTLSKETVITDEEPDPNYEVSLNYDYQDFTSFMFLGNRSESFSTYFNKFFTANEDFNDAMKEYKTSTLVNFNRRLDSINILTPVLQSTKDKFTKVIERCSKIIQYNKNTKYIDDAVLLIGLSYFYSNDFIQAERKFNEFLSKLSKSEIADDAILYLGITKFRLRKNADGETILKSLLQNSKSDEIKSRALEQLAVYNIGLKNITSAEDYLYQSIEITKDKEIKAERQFLLAKIYTIYNKEKAPAMYLEAYKNTSNFDFEFYAKLNEAKALNDTKRYSESEEILKKLDKKYLDYPDFKQLVELELANTDYYLKRYNEAKEKYFYVIVKYPGSKAAAESYYMLGSYYEKVLNNYLKALISYKKANETSTSLDYFDLSTTKATVIDRYFTLLSVINDTTKIEIPAEEPELQQFKLRYEEDMNKDFKKITNPKGNENLKGGGMMSRDTLPSDDSLMIEFQKVLDNKKKEQQKTDSIPLNSISDTNKLKTDTLINNNEIKKDSTSAPVINTDSINSAKETLKLNSYFELAEIFYYNLNRTDSSIFYLNKIINEFSTNDLVSKATFYLGTIYKSAGDSSKANEYFNDVIKKFPNTVYANESRKNLGLTLVLQTFDTADSLLTVADMLLNNEGKTTIPNVLREALTSSPQSPLIPKVYYTLGWYYENVQSNKDSMMKYYEILLKNYPNSNYSAAIKPTYDFYFSLNKKDTVTSRDSLTVIDSSTAKDSTKILQADTLKKEIIIPDKEEKQNESGEKEPEKKEEGTETPILKKEE